MNESAQVHPTNKAVLAAFLLYVLIPLTWGVVNTLAKALTLFG